MKRTCQSCGARFYDMLRSPIACPKCGTEFDPDAALKKSRARPAAAVAPVPEAEEAEEELVTEEAAEEEEEAVMEDTSELGEDNDDVAEVIDKVDDEDER